jgi:hypothetical protein
VSLFLPVYQSLPSHKKMLLLSERLQVEVPSAVGHMVCFWLWALDNTDQDGVLPNSAVVIETAAKWNGAPGAFLEAVIKVKYLDKLNAEEVRIHDWSDYTGRLMERRASDAERKRLVRAEAKAKKEAVAKRIASASGKPVQQTSGRRPADVLTHTIEDKTTEDSSLREPGNTQELTGYAIVYASDHGIPLDGQFKARIGEQVKNQLLAGAKPPVVKQALERLIEQNKAPNVLGYFVREIAGGVDGANRGRSDGSQF